MLRIVIMILAFIGACAPAHAQEATDEVIYTDNTNTSTVDSTSDSTTKVISPPPSAISPSINSANSDLCTVGVSGAVQTQILGFSTCLLYTSPSPRD